MLINLRHLFLTLLTVSHIGYSTSAFSDTHTQRTCNSEALSIFNKDAILTGGIGGTGHEATIPPGGIGGTEHTNTTHISDNSGFGGTGHEPIIPPGGIGGTGRELPTPMGGIGGTGIIAAGKLDNIEGAITVEDISKHTLQLAKGDEICTGDKIASAHNAKAKILFADGAVLYVLKNTEITVADYRFSPEYPKDNHSTIHLTKGDIRSVSGKISKLNPKNYSFKTPASNIHVIGTDFLITHLAQQEGALDAGTYTKVVSGEVSVQSATSTIRLRAGESSHVMLNGTQSVITSGGGTCSAP